jgi:WD40 repeat protein
MRPALLFLGAGVVALFVLPLGACTPGQTPVEGGQAVFNTPPTVVLTADVVRGIAPLTVRFSSVGSTDDGLIVSRRWDFGDGETSDLISPSHTFRDTGRYTVTLTLTDDLGATASRSIIISVTRAPVPKIKVDRETAQYAPATFSFDASESYDPDGTIVGYLWDFDDGSREILPVVDHTFSSAGTYRVRLTVTDNSGVTASTTQIILVGIRQPQIAFRLPGDDVKNIVVTPDSLLWVSVTFTVTPGVPYTLRAGLDLDADSCEAQAAQYDADSGAFIQRITGPGDRVRSVAFSPDGTRIILASDDGTARIYDLATGELALPAIDTGVPVTSVAFAPSGQRFAHAGTDGSVVVRDASTGQVIRSLAGHAQAVNALAFSAEGSLLASASDDGTIAVWDVTTGTAIVLDAALGGHTGAVNAVAFSPTNVDLLASGGVDRTIRLWRLSTMSVLRVYQPVFDGAIQTAGHSAAVMSVAFAPNGRYLASASADKTVKLWDLASDATVESATFRGHEAGVNTVAFSPDGQRLASGSDDGTARIWTIGSTSTPQKLTPCLSPVSSLAWAPDGTSLLLGVAARNDIQLDTATPQGNDLNLTLPTPLSLAGLTDPKYRQQYYLWAEIDTDRTDPVRTYATARVNLISPFVSSLTAAVPQVPLVDDEATIIAAPAPTRQICDLGALSAGDRISLALVGTPGYGKWYSDGPFSLMVLDAQGEVFVWYRDDVPFHSNDVLVVGHDSPNYYLVVDGCLDSPLCDRDYLASSVWVGIERGVGFQPRQQRIHLNFNGGRDLKIGDVGPFTIGPFSATQLNPAWGTVETEVIKTAIKNRMDEIFADYDVVISADAAELTAPYITIYFGGSATDFGAHAFHDPRNQTLSGAALVATTAIAQRYPTFSPSDLAVAFANVAAREAGYLMGLHTSAGGFNDIMDPTFLYSPTYIRSSIPGFRSAVLDRKEQYGGAYYGAIGIQNAPQLLQELVGSR